MDVVEHENMATRRRRTVMIALAALGVVAGVAGGFVSRALEPVKEFAVLPPRTGKNVEPLPSVYWLRRHTADGPGSPREKEQLIKAARPVALSDREIGSWLNRTFATAEVPKDDLDAVVGAAFVRIGGRLPGAEREPVLTVTLPFKLKFFSQPVTDVNLQFEARPQVSGGDTVWRYADIRLGRARIPEFIAEPLIGRTVSRYLGSTETGLKMRDALAVYRQVSIRDGRLFLAAPVPGAR